MIQINILGTKYFVEHKTKEEDVQFSQNIDGYVQVYQKRIVILRKVTTEGYEVENSRHALRHELVHAFMFESGLGSCSHDIDTWAEDEELVDWIALQMPKIMEVYTDVLERMQSFSNNNLGIGNNAQYEKSLTLENQGGADEHKINR